MKKYTLALKLMEVRRSYSKFGLPKKFTAVTK